jgi:hypothetical protein
VDRNNHPWTGRVGRRYAIVSWPSGIISKLRKLTLSLDQLMQAGQLALDVEIILRPVPVVVREPANSSAGAVPTSHSLTSRQSEKSICSSITFGQAAQHGCG